MSFKFTYEKLLSHRKVLRDIAERDFREVSHRFDSAMAELKGMYDEIDEAYSNASDLKAAQGGAVAEKLQWIDFFIQGQLIKIDRQKQKLREIQSILEEKQAVLTEAAKEFKIFEKLKEKLKERHKKFMNRQEAKQMDDLVVMRSRRHDDGA